MRTKGFKGSLNSTNTARVKELVQNNLPNTQPRAQDIFMFSHQTILQINCKRSLNKLFNSQNTTKVPQIVTTPVNSGKCTVQWELWELFGEKQVTPGKFLSRQNPLLPFKYFSGHRGTQSELLLQYLISNTYLVFILK